MFDAILTGMEAALLHARGLPTPKVEPLITYNDDAAATIKRTEWRAVIVTGTRRVEALGTSPDHATRNVIKLAVRD